MFEIVLKLFRTPEPEPKTYFESLIENVTNILNKFSNIFPIWENMDELFCNAVSFGIFFTSCALAVRRWRRFKLRNARQVTFEPNIIEFENGRLPVNYRASVKPFRYYPGLNVYVVHQTDKDTVIYNDGGHQTTSVQTVVSLQGNNLIIFEKLEEIKKAISDLQADTEDEDELESDDDQDETSGTSDEDNTVISNSVDIPMKPGVSRIPVIVARENSPTISPA